ncbi:phage integrase family protein [Dysgonomonas alginatilytica]|uniref:Phage integrase family protein n=1 Tax=Dysgonomonas alginatilytica TaxID=1605892 RepID=A0A2V3PTH5_9BACT|nr:tyrosine-type recombinase/integrase [Dysgonomonas alginatilytica]PXV66831.1 phage integrase family protein [Dysgonomonas alginatilytica]
MKITEFIDKLIATTLRGDRYKNRLRVTKELIIKFNKNLKVSDFTEHTTENFVEFLRQHPKKYRPNTIRCKFQILQTILNKASREFKIDSGYQSIIVKGEAPETIALSEKEIKAIIDVKRLSPKAEVVRDYFVLMCYTGLRFSDTINLRSPNIIGTNIVVRTQKTNYIVEIPIHPVVRNILEKYKYKLPQSPSQQSFGLTLRRICLKANLTKPITVEKTRGERLYKRVYSLYELITPHTGRRTFATNLYFASQPENIPLYRIMLLTGHTTQESFFKYIRIQKSDNARFMSDKSFFKPRPQN